MLQVKQGYPITPLQLETKTDLERTVNLKRLINLSIRKTKMVANYMLSQLYDSHRIMMLFTHVSHHKYHVLNSTTNAVGISLSWM